MKVWNYVIIAVGLALLMKMAGLPAAGVDAVLNLVGVSFTSNSATVSLSASSFYSSVFDATTGILIAGIAATVIIGFFLRTTPENYIILPFITGTLIVFVSTFVSVMNYAIASYPAWIWALCLLILVPFTAGYITAMVEFFRGTD